MTGSFYFFAVLYMSMKSENKQYLLQLSRQVLEYYFSTGNKLIVEEILDQELIEKRGTFVTLMIDNQLRGCVGHIEPTQAVYQDVIDNTLSAALEDDRFLPLEKEELNNLKIEISILTEPKVLEYLSVNDLLEKIIPFKHGVIIQKDKNSATYLPQVWEEISNKEEFLTSLCKKAGLSKDEWQRENLEVWVYEVEAFCE